MKSKFNFSLILFLLFLFGCGKDENPDAGNETNGKTTAVFNSSLTYGSLTDQDGNNYKTIKIGSQTWMAENLRTTKYNDGTDIKNITDESIWLADWKSYKDGAYCNYNNTENNDTIATFGRLYNGYTVKNVKLAPKGWHVATKNDWNVLFTFLGSSVRGKKLKEKGDTHWIEASEGVANESGFTALPAGSRNNYGFNFLGLKGNWSIYSLDSDSINYYIQIHSHYDSADIISGDLFEGFSVRCVKDN